MRYLVVIILLLGLVAVTPLSIETQSYAASRNQEESKERIISKRKAIQAAQREVKGKVLSAQLINSRGPAVYRVKMLVAEKRVRTVFVDGKSAKVIRIN
jgi:uncharacterized membrane protein YkoI